MKKFPVMMSMEMDDDEKMDFAPPIPMADKSEYPYGLRICLTDREFDKLGIDHTYAVRGGIFHLHALARITSVSTSDGELGGSVRVEAQIEDMAIESEDEENEENDAQEDRRSIYKHY
jgi:hypothetical protein